MTDYIKYHKYISGCDTIEDVQELHNRYKCDLENCIAGKLITTDVINFYKTRISKLEDILKSEELKRLLLE